MKQSLEKRIKEYNDNIQRNLHLRRFQTGELQGPQTNIPIDNKPWLINYTEEQLSVPYIGKTVYELLKEVCISYPNDIAINFYDFEITNEEFLKGVEDAAKGLKFMGVKKGDTVSICLPNTPESAYLLYACNKLGAVADYIDPIEQEEGLRHYLDISNPQHLITLDVVLSKFKNIVDDKNIRNVVIASEIESIKEKMTKEALNSFPSTEMIMSSNKEFINNSKANFMTYRNFVEEGKKIPDFNHEPYELDQPAVIVHSGGTSGTPKGILLSNDNLNEFASQIMTSDLQYKRGKKLLSCMPEFVGYGLTLGLHAARIASMETVMISRYEPEKLPSLILKYQTNVITGSPAHFELFTESKELDDPNIDMSYLDSFIVGGDTIHPTIEQKGNDKLKIHNSKAKVKKGYGFSEQCCAVTMCFNDSVNTLGGCGIPMTKTDITIYDNQTGKDLPYNEVGEICATAPNLMLKYLNNQEETDNSIRIHADGKRWFHSGDLGYISSEGYLYPVGRIKDLIIKYNGQKIYATNVESILSHHPLVHAIALIGVQDPDHYNGQVPVACVVFKEGVNETEAIELLREYASNTLVPYTIPVEFYAIEKMPKTKVGKVNKKYLRSIFGTEKSKKFNMEYKNRHRK